MMHGRRASDRSTLRRDMTMLVATLVMIAAVVGGATWKGRSSTLPYFRTAELNPEWLGESEANDATMHRVAAFRALNQAGTAVTERALGGRVTVVQFFFAQCGDICPTTTTNIARLLREEADTAVQVLSYSVTPERDSVAALRMFAAMRGIGDARWQLLTMDRASTESLAKDSYFVRLGADRTFGVDSIAHTETLVLVDGRGRVRGMYAGTLALEMQKLREDIGTLLTEQREWSEVSGRPSSSPTGP